MRVISCGCAVLRLALALMSCSCGRCSFLAFEYSDRLFLLVSVDLSPEHLEACSSALSGFGCAPFMTCDAFGASTACFAVHARF